MNVGRLLKFLPLFPILTFCLQANAMQDSTLQDTAFIQAGQALPDHKIEIENLQIIQRGGQIYLHSPENETGFGDLSINGRDSSYYFEGGIAPTTISPGKAGKLYFLQYSDGDQNKMQLHHVAQTGEGFRIKKIPLWLSIIPPLVAIGLALIFKEVIISLFAGIWVGAFIGGGLRVESIYFIFQSLFKSLEKYVINALVDSSHMSVIVFSLLIGGMVAIISKNGGMAGVVNSLSRFASGPKSTQFITWLLGIAIFFDDYANTLIVGNTMRSVTDKFRISREKLAYIVDSTAAPVSAIAFITTWIGAELGYIDDALRSSQIPVEMSSYGIFIQSLKYSFYPILTLGFVLILIYLRKEYGPMLRAEQRAIATGQVSSALTEDEDEPNMEDLSPVKGAPLRWYNAAIPVLVVIFMTIYGLVDTGLYALFGELQAIPETAGIHNSWSDVWANIPLLMEGENISFFNRLGTVIGGADPYAALLWSSMTGVLVAIILTVGGRIIKFFDTMHWMVTGFKTMMPALIILTLAWALAISTNELHTADYLSSSLRDIINPYLFPVIIFILAALIAFSTGSSWSTMAILYPIAIPASYAISLSNGLSAETSMEIMLNVIATVLAASVLGDHCSPISDTTILSSLASDCNHIDHVRTQLPYAMTVGAVSIVCVGLSTLLGGGIWISLILIVASWGIFIGVIQVFGRSLPDVIK